MVVSSIGDYAFSGQTRLREITLPDGLTNIGRSAFEGCSNLVSIGIPQGVSSIGESAFADNIRLSTIAFKGSSQLSIIGDFAFANCGSLEKIELPTGLMAVNGSAFSGTQALTSITVQQGNTAFISQDGVLFNQSGDTIVAYPAAHGTGYVLPGGTVNVGKYAFAYAKISSIDLTSIHAIGESAFLCSGLTAVHIPDGKYIGIYV